MTVVMYIQIYNGVCMCSVYYVEVSIGGNGPRARATLAEA